MIAYRCIDMGEVCPNDKEKYLEAKRERMNVAQIMEKRSAFSFEVFPPKTSETFENVRAATEEIARIQPDFMSVTYGAGGSTARYTLEICKNLLDSSGVTPLAHLTCVDSTKENVLRSLDELKAAGIENVMALRGDIPQNPKLPREKWSYSHANELML